MVIQPKTRGFICTTAHPTGCAKNVENQVAYAKQHPMDGPRRVLVIGSSTGYGLASRITAAFSCGADTIGVYFGHPSSGKRTANAGWYNSQAFNQLARKEGLLSVDVHGDAYADETKARVVDCIKNNMPNGQVDLVVYSLAAPKRTDPRTGETYSSVIKPIGQTYSSKTVDFHTGVVSEVSVEPATEEEIANTIAVMGGEDWLMWMQTLQQNGVLADKAMTVAFSYIGPVQTHAVYKDGTIGKAKEDLERRAKEIDALLENIGGKAFVSVNKALVTQASAAIPVVPLYISMLFKQMKAVSTHEDCIEQMIRLFGQRMYANGFPSDWKTIPVDEAGRIRIDDWEMDEHIQKAIAETWNTISTETLAELADIDGYRSDFFRLFGFGLDDVNYDEDFAQY